VRALLDGIDGDTIVSHGLERLPCLARSGRVMMLGRELRALSERHGAGVRDLLWRFGIHPLLPLGLRHAVRRMRRRRESALLAHSVIRPEFAREMGVLERLEASEARNQRPARTPGEAHRRAMESGLIQHALEMADKTAAAFAVEPRYPFLDRRLMELCLAIPADQKLRGGWTRSLMRRAMRGILPEEVRWRPTKANLAPNFTRRLLAQDRAFLSGILLGEPEVIEQFVDTTALRHAYERCVAGPTIGGDAVTIHAAVVLARWLQRTKLTA
jgi:asparagine synthase (glutamine-hydrolysing)